MEASFEDFLDLAEDRLQRAALAITDGARVGSPTCAALSAATRSVITLGSRYGLMPSGVPATAWQPAFVDRLTAADRYLRRHAQSAAAPTAADELIGDAARLLTVAQDLLATHLTTPDPPRPFARTAEGEQLLGAPVRDHLLRRAAELAGELAQLTRTALAFDDLTHRQPSMADAYRPRGRDLASAAGELADAAAQCPAPSAARLELAPAPALAAAFVAYPQPGEEPAMAAEHIREALRRLATAAYRAAQPLRTGGHPPAHAAGDLREGAAHFAVAHVLAADLLTRLVPYLPAAAGWDAAEAADRLRRPWAQSVSVPDSGPRSPLTVQATGIATRLGRLLYADPTWTPQAGPGRHRPLGVVLEPETLDAVCVAISALPREAATIAANHARLVTDAVVDLHSTDRTHRPDDQVQRTFPLQAAQRAELASAYRQAAHASTSAAAGLAPLARGYRALKAAGLVRSPRRAEPRTLDQPAERARHAKHQQPDEGRGISPGR
jgi:hypothetical protein